MIDMEGKAQTARVACVDAGRHAAPASETVSPRGCTNLKLRQFTRLVSRMYDAQLGACGLKTTQYSLLASIDRLGPLQPGDLARSLSLDPSTLTRNLQPLVDAGWVDVAAGHDGRSRLIGVTDAGRKMRALARGHWKRAQQEIDRTLGVERVAALHALIDEAQQLLEAHERDHGAIER